MEHLLPKDKIISIWFVLICISVSAQTNIRFTSPFLRDVIVTDNYIFTSHLLSDTGLNVTGKAIIYQLNQNLEMIDSLFLDSVAVIKVINHNQNLYITAVRNYPDGITRSVLFYRIDSQLTIQSKKEVKETGSDFSQQSFHIPNDSLKILISLRRNGGNSYFYEWTTDTLFNNIDTNSCKINNTTSLQFYYQQSTDLNNKSIYSGLLEGSQDPLYYSFNTDGNCNMLSPFQNWVTSVSDNTYNMYLGKHTNQVLKLNNSFLIPTSAEQSNGQMNAVGNILKTDFDFNLDTFCIADPNLNNIDVTPFRSRSIGIADNKIIFGLNTHADIFAANPGMPNEIIVYVLDTNLNIYNSKSLNPFNTFDQIYYGTHLVTFNDVIYLCGTITTDFTDSKSFIVKYNSVSEVLDVNSNYSYKRDIKIYPNPCTKFLNIDLENFNDAICTIYNLIGEKILSFPLTRSKIDIETLTPGKYLIQITDNNFHYTGSFLKVD